MKPTRPPNCPFCRKQPAVKGFGLGFAVMCTEGWSHNVSVYGQTPEEAIERWHEGFSPKRPWWAFWRERKAIRG